MKGQEIPDEKKLSIAHCQKVLSKDGSTYSDEEVLVIRDFLYQMAWLDYNIYINRNNNEKERNSIHQGIDR